MRHEKRECQATEVGRTLQECKGLMRELSRLGSPIYEDRSGNSRRFVPGDYALTRPSERIHASNVYVYIGIYECARPFARAHSVVHYTPRSVCLGLPHSIRDIPHSSHTCKNTLVGTRCPRCLMLIRTMSGRRH